MKNIFLLFLGQFIAINLSFSQMNDSTHFKIKLSTQGNINHTQTSSSQLFLNGFGFDITQKKLELNSIANWIYGENDKKVSNNDWNALINLNCYTNFRPVYYWGLFSYNSSYSLQVNQQFQTGAGLAVKFFEGKDFSFSISDGILYEWTNITTNEGDIVEYNTWRNSLRLKVKYKYKDLANISTTFFHQPSLQIENDYILISMTSLQIKLWKWISINTQLQYNKVSRTEKENFTFSYGLSFEKSF